ncbi:MAG: hypothetical protein RJA99_3346 [Pseudomonadota bacterium]
MLDLSALDGLRPSELLDAPAQGQPIEIALDAIDVDPAQPRKRLDPEALQALAATIRRCGVIQPISVHASPQMPGRFVINVGERRVRAARLAGRATIPAFVERPLDAYARVIENLAREDLSPFDLGTFIVEREAAGESRKSIAEALGKAQSFVTELAELARAPESVRTLHERGRCSDVRILYRLSRLAVTDPEPIRRLAAEDSAAPVTRGRLEGLLKGEIGDGARNRAGRGGVRRRRVDSLLVEVDGRLAFMPLKRPDSMGAAQVVYEDGSREQVELRRLRLIQWTVTP